MPSPRPRIRLEGRPGELLDSGMRMCLLDVDASFYGLRKSVEGIIGEAAATLFYDSGFRGGLRYAEALLQHGVMTPDEEGYRRAIREYSEGGFGAFEIREIDFTQGKAVVVCREPMAFEAHAVIANGERRSQPICDFSRGVLVGLLSGFSKRTKLGCFEEACRAAGGAECVFRIGDEDAMRRASVARNMSRRSTPTPA